jgi:hypothetical protein
MHRTYQWNYILCQGGRASRLDPKNYIYQEQEDRKKKEEKKRQKKNKRGNKKDTEEEEAGGFGNTVYIHVNVMHRRQDPEKQDLL